jgi:hypothetical protein
LDISIMPSGFTAAAAANQLARYFENGGYFRLQNEKRLEKEGRKVYKKGDEVRMMADSPEQLETIRSLLRAAGFVPGAPFRKGRRICQPLYGLRAVDRFLTMLEGSRQPADESGGREPGLPMRKW